MGRAPCCDKQGLKKGPWTPEEDKILIDYIQSHGHGSWRSLPKLAGLLRCGKSCRLRWTNYLRPDIKRGAFTPEEQKSIIQLHGIVGNKWSTIAAQLPGRTDNEIKNYWNTHLKKRLLRMGLIPDTFAPASTPPSSPSSPSSAVAVAAATARHMAQWESARLEAEARLSRESLLFCTSTTGSSTPSTATTSSLLTPKTEPDFFLRMWHSEIGDSFRKQPAAVAEGSTSTSKQSSGAEMAAVAAEEEERREEATESKSWEMSTSNEVGDQEMSGEDDAYQLYLDFDGDDIGLFHPTHLAGSFSSLFTADINDISLDTAFK